MRYPEDCSGNRAFPKDPTLPFSRRLWGNGRTGCRALFRGHTIIRTFPYRSRGAFWAGENTWLLVGWLAGCLVACALFRGHTIIRTFPYRSRGAFWAGENTGGWVAGWLCPVPGPYDNTDLSLPFSRSLLGRGEHRLAGGHELPCSGGHLTISAAKKCPGISPC
jgi:hypothetical protein